MLYHIKEERPRLRLGTGPVNTDVQHGYHFGHPCSRAVFTGAGPHYLWTRPVNTAREHGYHFGEPWTPAVSTAREL